MQGDKKDIKPAMNAKPMFKCPKFEIPASRLINKSEANAKLATLDS